MKKLNRPHDSVEKPLTAITWINWFLYDSLAYSFLQCCFRSSKFVSICLCTALLWSHHSISVWSLLWGFFSFFKIFCCSFAHVLGMIVLLQTISIQLLTMWTDSLEFYSWLLWYTEELMLNSVISRCPVAAQQAWNRHPSTFVLTVGTRCLCWYAVLGFCQMCHCALWPNISTFVSYVQRTFFQKTCFAQKYLCKLCCHVPFRRTAFFRPLL